MIGERWKRYKINEKTVTTVKLDEYIIELKARLELYKIPLGKGKMSQPTYNELLFSSIKGAERMIEKAIPLGKKEGRLNEEEAKHYITQFSEILIELNNILREVNTWNHKKEGRIYSKK